MRPKDIEVGKTYRNRGKARTKRQVTHIGDEYRPTAWFSDRKPPDEPGVYFTQWNWKGGMNRRWVYGGTANLYLSSFAAWCGGEV
jgi:hypothetical protein